MTTNQEKVLKILSDAMFGNLYSSPEVRIEQAVLDLAADRMIKEDLPKATINPVDGNPEWKPKEFHLVEVDWGEVTYWIEGQPFTNTPKEAREIARSLEAAADYAEEEALEGEEK